MVLTSILAKGALAVAGLGAIGLGAAALIPIADLTADSWFDQPVDGAVLVEGVHDIRVHYRWGMGAAGLKVVSTTEFGEFQLTDDTLALSSDEPGIASYLAEYTVELVAGEYDLTPSGTRDGSYPAIHVVVLSDGVTEVPEDVPAPRPTETPEPEETEPPLEQPTDEPGEPEAPGVPDPVGPAPSPSSAPSVPAGPAFSGSVSRSPGVDQWTSTFVGSGIGPAGAATRVQVNSRNLDTGAMSGWVSVACVDVGGGQCTAQRFTAPKPGASSTAVPPYEITFRLEVVSAGVTWYGSGGTWYTDRYFNVG
jgi:hypothetical protein